MMCGSPRKRTEVVRFGAICSAWRVGEAGEATKLCGCSWLLHQADTRSAIAMIEAGIRADAQMQDRMAELRLEHETRHLVRTHSR
jgi:hypothetical protein